MEIRQRILMVSCKLFHIKIIFIFFSKDSANILLVFVCTKITVVDPAGNKHTAQCLCSTGEGTYLVKKKSSISSLK